MTDEGSAKPGEAEQAKPNAADEAMRDMDSAELMGSVASELGIGGAVQPAEQKAEETGKVEETTESTTEETEKAEETTEETETDEAVETGKSKEKPESEQEEPEEEVTEHEVKGLTEEGRALVNKRIGKVVAQRNEARERIGTLEQQIGQLQEQVDKPVRAQIAQVLGVDPMFVAQSEQELSESEAHWWQVKRFTEQHMHKDDGFTDEKSGTTFSREQLQARHAQADEMLMRGLPQARQLFTQRKQCVETAKAAYPELFKTGTPESAVRASALKSIPGLAQLPNADILIGDMIAGQKLRETGEKKNDKANTKVEGKTNPLEKTKPAKVPVKPAPANRSPVAKKVAEQNPDLVSIGSVAADLGI